MWKMLIKCDAHFAKTELKAQLNVLELAVWLQMLCLPL